MASPQIKKQTPPLKTKQGSTAKVKSATQKTGFREEYILPGILIITAVVFANSLTNGFIENLDDNAYILTNQTITHLDWSSIKVMFSSFFQGNYHPLTLLTFAIEYKISGLSPFTFHFTNFILHIVNTYLVFKFIKRFTGKINVAAITALFFGIHPMHVESVSWITERKDVLYALFFLLALNSYTFYLTGKDKNKHLFGVYLWFFLSLLSKPAAVCLPLVLVVIDYYYFNTFTWKSIFSKIPLFILSVLFGILTILSQRSFNTINDFTPLYNFIDRFFLLCYSIVYYPVAAIAPFNLSAMHFFPAKSNNMLPLVYYVSFPLILLIIWGVIKSGQLKKELVFGLLFYLSSIVLELEIIPVGQTVVSERYSYIPYIGMFFMLGQFFNYIQENKLKISRTLKPYVTYLIIGLAILYSILTILRNRTWKNGEILFTDIIKKNPENGWSWYALGNSRNDKKDYDTAIMYYTKAISLGANFSDVYFNRANSENNKRDFKSAITDYNTVTQLNPGFAQAYINRGNCEKALRIYDAALNDYSKSIEFGLYSAYFNRGIVEDEMKQFDAAITDYTKAIELDTKEADTSYAEAYFNRGNTKSEKMDYKGAIADYSKAIELYPEYVNAYLNRGATENGIKDLDNALRDFTKAISLLPNSVSAYFNRGIVENEKNDFNGSIRDFSKAIELAPAYSDAYYYRGVSKYSLMDKNGACADWQLALQNGNAMASAILNQLCK